MRHEAILVALAAILVTLAGCGGGDPPAEPVEQPVDGVKDIDPPPCDTNPEICK
jgi:hypothetical protein